MYDFAIIGAGMAGVSVADALAPDAQVVVLEAESQPGYHATARSAALFAPNYGSESFCALARGSLAFLQAPPPQYFPAPLLNARGAMLIARTDQLPRLEALITQARSRGSAVQVLAPAEACTHVPLLREAYLARASYEPNVYDMDVNGLLQGFMARAKAHGAQVRLNAQVTQISRTQHAWRLQLNNEVIAARTLINAAGAWGDAVAAMCNVPAIGLQPLRRTAALFDPPEGVAIGGWPVIFDADEQFYLKPDAGKLLISPADEDPAPPGDAFADDLTIAIGIDRMQQAMELEVRRITHSWAGLRTFAPDRDPVIGFDTANPHFFWYVGQGGYGIQTAYAGSRMAAALARREPVPAALAAERLSVSRISPTRFNHPRA